MKPKGYAPPSARVGDVLPEAPGPMPDWAAVIIGVAVEYFLAVYVADTLATFFAAGFAGEEDTDMTLSLSLDLLFTWAANLFALWMTLHLCRSRSFLTVSITAALCWLILFGDRWIIDPSTLPLWYEVSLLFCAPLALAVLYARARGFHFRATA